MRTKSNVGVQCPHCNHLHGWSWEGTPTNSIHRTERCAKCEESFRCWEETETIYRATTEDGSALRKILGDALKVRG